MRLRGLLFSPYLLSLPKLRNRTWEGSMVHLKDRAKLVDPVVEHAIGVGLVRFGVRDAHSVREDFLQLSDVCGK